MILSKKQSAMSSTWARDDAIRGQGNWEFHGQKFWKFAQNIKGRSFISTNWSSVCSVHPIPQSVSTTMYQVCDKGNIFKITITMKLK